MKSFYTLNLLVLILLSACGRDQPADPAHEDASSPVAESPSRSELTQQSANLDAMTLDELLAYDRQQGLHEIDERLQRASPEEKQALLMELLPYLLEDRDPAFLSDASSLLAREYANYDLPDGVGRTSFSFEAVFINYALLEIPLRQDAVDALTLRLERRGTLLVPFERLDVLLMGIHQIEGFESALDDIVSRGRGMTYPTALTMQARHGNREAIDKLLEYYRSLTPGIRGNNLRWLVYANQPEIVTYLVQLAFSDEMSTEGSLWEHVDYHAGEALNKMMNAYPYRNFMGEADYSTEDAIVLMREWIKESIDDQILTNAGITDDSNI
tara:strand:+ start:661 stop:1641 length:981 start_codon:yes stop_codon:yes gene_type:complete